MKKKILATLLAALMLFSLVGCGNSGHIPGDNPPMMEDIPNQEIDPEWEAQQEEAYNPHYSKEDKNKPFIEYASFDEYGEWSEGFMWVRRTEKSWDKVTEYIGYIDQEGNVVGGWHEFVERSDKDNFRDIQDAYAYLDAMEDEVAPLSSRSLWDFQGGFAVKRIQTYQEGTGITGDYYPLLQIMNTKGEIVFSFLPLDYYRTDTVKQEFSFVNGLPIFYVSTAADWDGDRYLGETPAMYMIFPEGDTVREFLIEGSVGEEGFYSVDHFVYDLNNRRFANGYCSMIDGDRAYLFDQEGKTAFEIEFKYRIEKLYAEGNSVFMQFIGADKKTTYEVEMDWQGNWLNEPEPVG